MWMRLGVYLRPRLNAVLELITQTGGAQTIADIGCDHGRLCVAALERNVCRKAIACDISEQSLNKTRRLASSKGFKDSISIRHADGLSAISIEEADTIVLAGMGGTLIARLLQKCELQARAARQIIMQPMRSADDLRRFLFSSGYNIFSERLIEDGGRIYQIIAAKSGLPESRPDWWPENLFDPGWVTYSLKDPLLPELLRRWILGRQKRIKAAGAAAKGAALELQKELDDLFAVQAAVYREQNSGC